MKLTLKSADYHRNGISGEPFRVALFRDETEKRDMLAILTDEPGDDYGQRCNGRCYVLDVAMIAEGNIRFGENSWRGDNYEEVLRPLIEAEFERQAGEVETCPCATCAHQDSASVGSLSACTHCGPDDWSKYQDTGDAYPTGTVDDLERYPNDGGPWPGEAAEQ